MTKLKPKFKGISAYNKGKTYKRNGLERKGPRKCRKCGAKTLNYFYCHNCLVWQMEVPTDFCGYPVDGNNLIEDYEND